MDRPGPRPSRRAFLATAGATTTALLASTHISPVDGDPAPGSTRRPPSRNAQPDDEPFSEETIERARTVGKEVRESVIAMERDGKVFGTQWYFQEPTLAATAGHLFRDDETEADPTFDAWLAGGRSLELTLLGTGTRDVAAMRASVPVDPLPAGDPNSLTEGQPLVQVGNPRDVGNWVISLGRFRDKPGDNATRFSGSVPSIVGSSGSPTLTLDGEVVGMLVGTYGDQKGVNSSDPDRVYGPGEFHSVTRHLSVHVVQEFLGKWSG